MSYWLLFWGLSGLGFLLLGPVLKRRERNKRIRLGLPDAADLIAVCIEAGLSPAESLAHVSKVLGEAHPDLSEELYLVNRGCVLATHWTKHCATCRKEPTLMTSKCWWMRWFRPARWEL